MRESHIWTGPKSKQEIDRFLDNLLLEGRENTSIAGKSGLQRFNTRRWNVIERRPPGEEGKLKPPIRFAVLIEFKIQGNWIDTDVTDESEGFHEYDIPRKLLDLLDGHPPVNESAGRWRRKCAEHMEAKREGEKLLKRLRKILQETGERPRCGDRRPHRGVRHETAPRQGPGHVPATGPGPFIPAPAGERQRGADAGTAAGA